jgi:hypothetical protein
MGARFFRLLAGLATLAVIVPTLFTIMLPAIHRWGASDAELQLALPGDELLPAPQVRWTHGISIDAPPERVWPWIAQLGDGRGGFYSFTFIENRVGSLTGAADYQAVYRNANQIVPAWQHPDPGDQLIQGVLKVRALQPGSWLLADSLDPAAFGWAWLWYLQPLDGGARTRLIVRLGIQAPAAGQSPVANMMMDFGGFVMEQRMLHGIQLRAEGWREPAWNEGAEIALWLAALACGLLAAGLFVLSPSWERPLGVALASVALLFVLTFAQPALWARLLLDGAAALALWWAARGERPASWGWGRHPGSVSGAAPH